MKKRSLFSVLMPSALALAVVSVFLASPACTKNDAKAKPNLVFKTAPNNESAAKIGDEVITEEALIGSEKLTYLELQKKLYDFKMKRLNDLIKERLLGAEAKKAGMSVKDYIDKKLTKGKLKVSKKEYEEFVKKRKISKSQISDKLKERIDSFLKEQKKDKFVQAHLAKLTRKNPIEVYFNKPKVKIDVAVNDAPVWGKKGAPVTIIEFSDFQCPYCARAAKTMDAIKKKYKGKVQIAFKHFPLSFHKQARPASEASMCVNEQGSDKFWKFYKELFENQKSLDPASLEKYAKNSGADTKKYQDCMNSKKYADFVQKDIASGEKLGIRSTPTFLVNGELVSGALPVDAFSDVIDEALSAIN